MIVESRSVWSYSSEYVLASLPLITVNESYIQSNTCYEIKNPDLVGFFAIEKKESTIFLDHFWIKKSVMEQGVGKFAMHFIDILAIENGWKKIFVYPDPPAEGFYLKCGYIDTGKRIPSRISCGPIFSMFEKNY